MSDADFLARLVALQAEQEGAKPGEQAELRELTAAVQATNAQLERLLTATTSGKSKGDGNGGGWLGKYITERAIMLLVAAVLALASWVGITNVRYALLFREVQANAKAIEALPPDWLMQRLQTVETTLQRHIEATGGQRDAAR